MIINQRLMSKLEKRIEPSKKIKALCSQYEVDWHELDWKSLNELVKDYSSEKVFIDEVLLPKIKSLSKNTETIHLAMLPSSKKEAEFLEQEAEQKELLEQQEKAEQKELELIEQIKQSKTPELDKYYRDLDIYLRILEKTENITGLLLIGDAGIGKSFYIKKKFKGTNILLSGHITPKELYLSYLNHPYGHIIIDDPSSIYSNIDSLGLLLQATQTEPIRTIHWHTSTLKVPKTTIFYGKTTLIQNYEPNNDILESRCLIKNLHYNFDTKIKMLYEFAKVINAPLEIVDEIKNLSKYGEILNKKISFRTIQKLLAFYNNDKDWRNRVFEVVGIKQDRLEIYNFVLELNKKHNTIKDMEGEFVRNTKLSRATFYNFRAELSLNRPYSKRFK